MAAPLSRAHRQRPACRHRFDLRALDRDNRDPRSGRWNITAPLVPQTVANAPCLNGAKYCYTYFQITFTFPDGSKTTTLLIVGVKSF